MLRDAASGRDLTGWVDLYGAHRGRSIRGYPSAGAGVGAEWRGRAGSRGCGVPQQEASAGCRRVPPSRDPARVPRAPAGPARARGAPPRQHHRPAHGAARGRATATGDPNVPARIGTAAYPARGRAHPTGPVRGSALFPRFPRWRYRVPRGRGSAGALPAESQHPGERALYSVYTDLYARHCFRSLGPCAKGRKRRCHEGTRQTPHLVRGYHGGYQCADRWRETPGLIETSRQDCRATRHRRHPPGQCPRQQPPQGPAAAAQRQAQGMWGAPTAAGRWLCNSM